LHQVFEGAQDGGAAAPLAPELVGPVQEGGGEPFGEGFGAAGEQHATMADAADTQCRPKDTWSKRYSRGLWVGAMGAMGLASLLAIAGAGMRPAAPLIHGGGGLDCGW